MVEGTCVDGVNVDSPTGFGVVLFRVEVGSVVSATGDDLVGISDVEDTVGESEDVMIGAWVGWGKGAKVGFCVWKGAGAMTALSTGLDVSVPGETVNHGPSLTRNAGTIGTAKWLTHDVPETRFVG